MRYPIPVQIFDPNSVLSDVDQHQVESMVWLRLSPLKEGVSKVKFEIKRLPNEEFGREHLISTSVKLKSGHVVESSTARISKGAALMVAVDEMKSRVDRRIRFEMSWIFKSIGIIKLLCNSVLRCFRLQIIEMHNGNKASRVSGTLVVFDTKRVVFCFIPIRRQVHPRVCKTSSKSSVQTTFQSCRGLRG